MHVLTRVLPTRSGRVRRNLVSTLAALALWGCADDSLVTGPMPDAGPHRSRGGVSGAVFTSTNAANGNAVVAFRRGADGGIVEAESYPTGGLGLGVGIGSQGAVVLTADGKHLLVVDAGSDEVAVFAVDGERLALTDHVPSGGDRPVSIAVSHSLVYVLNAGSDDLVAFELSGSGKLSPISGATHALGGSGTGAAQASFSPRGDLLVVTERATNQLKVFTVGRDGHLAAAGALASASPTPFGFAFARNGYVVVSEANGGAPAGGQVSSYSVDGGTVSLVTGPVPNGETAPCWVLVSRDHRYAFVANAGTSSISSYAVTQDGQISLLQGAAGVTGAGSVPLDMAFSRNGRFLYAVTPGAGTVSGFRVADDGGLSSVGSAGTLPASAYGLAGS